MSKLFSFLIFVEVYQPSFWCGTEPKIGLPQLAPTVEKRRSPLIFFLSTSGKLTRKNLVQTRRTIDHPISSQSHLERVEAARILVKDNDQNLATGQQKGLVDSNYNDPSLEVGEHDFEVVRQLKMQNKALFELLKNHLKTSASSQSNGEEDDTTTSSKKPPPTHAERRTSK